ncbi:ribonuclease H-like domain-containing protein [Mycena albidolilacea]|uniref:Ribonuclease H-like domain-containing protein n=1 Tax=Mycena albidolilacea TaxID=1033008 RepID=A0AAD6ZUM9_9AGAR|nr:ribonuclease H-like domain-containing protein [Mycena albidolilacea]
MEAAPLLGFADAFVSTIDLEDTVEEVEAFKAWISTLIDPDGVLKPPMCLLNIPLEQWNTIEATTNLGEAQHAWNNAQTGISMGVIESFKKYEELDIRRAEEIEIRKSTAVPQNARNEGKDVVKSCLASTTTTGPQDRNIFSSFTRTGQCPVKVTHRTHTQPEFHAHIMRWLAEANRPFKIMEDRELTVPNFVTLENYNGWVSFATDAWMSPNHRAFVAWTVHPQHEGQPLVFLLDIFEVPESHMGEILGWAGDNATVNDTQNTALGNNPNNSFQPQNHVRCFTHTLKLGIKSFLHPFQPPEKRKKGNSNTDDPSDGDSDTSSELSLELEDSSLSDLVNATDGDSLADDDGEEDKWDEMDEVEKAAIIGQMKQAKAVISQVRKFSFALVPSTAKALPPWHNTCSKKNMAVQLLPQDNLPLCKYELSDTNWMIVEDMVYTFEIFKQATLLFSSDNRSTIANVITTMDKIGDLITSTIALGLAKTMNKYYLATDMSNIYCIAMVLHLSLKLEYFRSRNWADNWITTAKELVSEEYEMYLTVGGGVDDVVEVDGDMASMSSSTADMSTSDWFGLLNLDLPSGALENNHLEQYLREPLEPGVTEPLKWWWARHHIWSELSRMALDYHSVPFERVFSRGCHLLVFTRNHLNAVSIHKLLRFGSWCQKDLVRDDNIIKGVEEVMGSKKCKAEDQTSGAVKKVRKS